MVIFAALPFYFLISKVISLLSEIFIPIFFIFIGIFFTEGALWHEQRRFALRYLRDFGFGRRFESLENEIHDEIMQFIDMLKFGPTYPHEQVNFKIINLLHL